MTWLKNLLFTLMLLTLTAIPAAATTIYTLSTPNAGIAQAGPGPYAQVSVTLQDADTARIQVDSLNSYLFGEVGLSVLGSNAIASNFLTLPVMGTGNYYFDTGSKNLDGFGLFNVTLTPKSDGFPNALSQLIFTLDNLSTTAWTSDSMVFCDNDSGNGYVAAAHVFDGGNFFTGFAAHGPPSTPVPEPSTMMLLCAGLLGVAVCGKSRKATSGPIMM